LFYDNIIREILQSLLVKIGLLYIFVKRWVYLQIPAKYKSDDFLLSVNIVNI